MKKDEKGKNVFYYRTLFVYTKTVHNFRGNKCAFIYLFNIYLFKVGEGGLRKGEGGEEGEEEGEEGGGGLRQV
jgi:hypothetical protein